MGLPIGINAVNQLFKTINYSADKALIIGLGGSLSSSYKVGDVVIYESCSYFDNGELVTKKCDRDFNNVLRSQLNAPIVKGLTTDKLIVSPSQKQLLQQQSNCSVVDMESYGVMSYFDSVSVVRVISDNVNDFLPDLNLAISDDGKLNKWRMSIVFLTQPLKAIKLIRNALISLKKLETVSRKIDIY